MIQALAAEAYRNRYGCYPEAVLADKAYRNRENLRDCRQRGISLTVLHWVAHRRQTV
ncbi:MAG: hypothetical protein IRY98_12720 [Alicyclobacillaceae bacterium]|nr:hypothetical protein [Alicyclobacillaceae bacterium]